MDDLHMGLLRGLLYKILLKFSKNPETIVLVVFYSLRPLKWHGTWLSELYDVFDILQYVVGYKKINS